MEDSDLAASEHIPPDREYSEHRSSNQFSNAKHKKIDLKICRVCLGNSGLVVNIFGRSPGHSISIAQMVSLVTGHPVSKSDSFPKNICRSCLEDVTKALKIKQTYQQSHKFFCQLREDSRKAGFLLDKKSCTQTQPVVKIQVKTERVDIDLLEKEEPYLDQLKVPIGLEKLNDQVQDDLPDFQVNSGFEVYSLELEDGVDQCPVRNEPIEDDSSEGNPHLSDGEVDLFDNKVKSEKTENQSDQEGLSRHKCSHCPKSFYKACHLKVHTTLCHTEERPYKCSQCESAFKTPNCLKRHFETHSSRKEYKCDLCERSYVQERSFKIHRFRCLKNSEKSSLLEKVRSQPYKCSQCPKAFSEESDLSEHVLAHSGEMTYVCFICDRSFIQKLSLQRHLRWHKDERTFKCAQCPKSFLDEEQLNEHILTHQGIYPFKCSQCPKSFLLKHSLDRHFRSHTGERPYKCSQCEQSFAFSNHLKLHTLAHAGQSPYQCPHCPKSFFGKHLLANHIRTHTGERPFKCPHCPKDFKTKYALQGHMRKHTGERPYKCDICQKTFAIRGNFKSHMFTHRDQSL